MTVAAFCEKQWYRFWYRVEAVLEYLQGVDFHRHHSCQELGTNPEESIWYVNSGDIHLARVLSQLPIEKTDALFDFGCGKGGVLRIASKYPFRKLGGIEISGRLSRIASANLRRLRIEADILWGDASTFTDLDEYTFFYFFNPFKEGTMRRVLTTIQASLERKPRPLTIIYKNPVYGTLVESMLSAQMVGTYPASFGLRFHVYRREEEIVEL